MVRSCNCGTDSQVLESRLSKDGIRRRRRCPACGSRWSTIEHEIGPRSRSRGGSDDAPTKSANPLVVTLFEAKKKADISFEELERKSGVPAKTIKNWKRHPAPNLSNIVAVLDVLDYDVIARRKPRRFKKAMV